jgi:ABC-type uncharacterized transport system YnjBCD substrate-binding protein
MSGFQMPDLTRDKMLSPAFYRSVAEGLTTSAADLRKRYVPYQETYTEPHHSFLGGLFGRKSTKTRTAYPAGYMQAMNDATMYENQATYYKSLADYIEQNPLDDSDPTADELAALDPNGPDIGRGSLTITIPPNTDQSPTINPSMAGGAGLRIPYGT